MILNNKPKLDLEYYYYLNILRVGINDIFLSRNKIYLHNFTHQNHKPLLKLTYKNISVGYHKAF